MTPGAWPADLSLKGRKPAQHKNNERTDTLWAGWDIVKCYFAYFVFTRPCMGIGFLCKCKHLVYFYVLNICCFWCKYHQGSIT